MTRETTAAEDGSWIGREREAGELADLIAGLRGGRGGSVFIEGEPGIGKTTLLELTSLEAARFGCRVLHATASELGHGFPLRPLLGCLDQDRATETDRPEDSTHTMAVMERLIRLLTAMLDEGPLVLMLDDLHWADDATLLLWQRLSRMVGRVPLLLVATLRAVPDRPEVSRLRRGLLSAGTRLIELAPMTRAEVATLAQSLLGAAPGPGLCGWLTSAGGNPLFVRELLDALRRDQGVEWNGPVAELAGQAASEPPPPPDRAVGTRLSLLSAACQEALRGAALLGTEFTARELAVVLDRSPWELLAVADEAVPAGVLVDTGDGMRFRHPVIRQALYAALEPEQRAEAHGSAAQALAAGGASMDRVAEQLLHAGPVAAGPMLRWITEHAEPLATRCPAVAMDLIQRAMARLPPEDPGHSMLERHLGTAAFLLRRPESSVILRRLLDRTRDPENAGQLTMSLVHSLFWQGGWDEAIEAIAAVDSTYASDVADATNSADSAVEPSHGPVTAQLRNRLRALGAIALWSAGREAEAAPIAAQAVAEAVRDGDDQAEAYGRQAVALGLMRARRTESALAESERALAASHRAGTLGKGGQENTDLRISMLVTRAVMLGTVDRMEDALEALREAGGLSEAQGIYGQFSGIAMSSAVLNYWTGLWDDALTGLSGIEDLPGIAWMPVLRHGVEVLIHGHRDDEPAADAAFRQLRDLPDPEGLQRSHSSYRLMAGALMAERAGRQREALAVLLPTLDAGYAKDLDQRYQWLPDIVRLALSVGDIAIARAAAFISTRESSREPHAGRAAAASRCNGMTDGDPALLLSAVEYYTEANRPLQAGQAREDLAVVLATLGRQAEAREQLLRATECYGRIGAAWDIRRARTRLRALGVRTAAATNRTRPESGWEALTPAELKVAGLVSQGHSNPEIAAELFLSPRTVQTHVSHILAKLGLRSRTEVARKVYENLGSVPQSPLMPRRRMPGQRP
ncbi:MULTISPECIES: helix-turn-helix transcriptional regulator [Streptomyces]|uniref:helix-turn-helix transcriptional regulator n=1 Tax=Streptomyces TaxID=1883 RepID=UPI00068C7B44|nr:MULTISPECIES: LuxR family transcriptional regulator [Streptomyces]